ncbi:MAG: NADH-quinone oxidoreductase subunit N [Dehalococcoidia bacterium]
MSWHDHFHLIGPALALLIGSGVVLAADMLWPRRAPVWGLTLLALALAALYALWHGVSGTRGTAFEGAIVVDDYSIFFAFVILTTAAAVTLAAREWAAAFDQTPEFFALLLVSAGAMVVLVQSVDLIMIFVALETTSIAQFVMAGIARDDRGSEAGLKYLLTGAVAAAVLLYGFTFLWGLSGTTQLAGIAAFVALADDGLRLPLILAFVFVAAGFGFKMAIVPFHAWVPDVYQGAPIPVASFLSVASKAAGFAVVLRVFYTGLGGGGTFIANEWAIMFGVFAAASMLFGNMGALLQTNVKRLLGYSSIAQAGNIAVGLAAVAAGSTLGPSGVLFFIGTYVATNLGAFLTVLVVSQRLGSDEMSAYAGLIRRSPVAASILALCLLSLTGIPPTAGFIAKVYVFNAAVRTDEAWLIGLVAIAVVNTAISAYYYLRWVRTMLLDAPADDSAFAPSYPAQAALAAAAIGVLFIGLIPTPLMAAAQRAAEVLQ